MVLDTSQLGGRKMKVLVTNNLTGITEEIEIECSTQLSDLTPIVEPTPEQRIADMEAEIVKLKAELNVN